MKSIARVHVWWPGIDKKIEEVVKSCLPCQSNRKKPPLTSLHLWNWPSQPWRRLHLDFLGPFLGATFLIVVDAYSKWLEVVLQLQKELSQNSGSSLQLMDCQHKL